MSTSRVPVVITDFAMMNYPDGKGVGDYVGSLPSDAEAEVRATPPYLGGVRLMDYTVESTARRSSSSGASNLSASAADCVVYFDGACPPCRRDIAHYRGKEGTAAIVWVDAANCDPAALGVDLARDAKEHCRRQRPRRARTPVDRLPRRDEADRIAVALGYRHDAAKVAKAIHPTHVAGRNRANCQLFAAKGSEEWAPCSAVGNKLVNAKGWCVSWVKKA